VITVDYSGIGLSTGCHAQQIFYQWQKMSKMLLRFKAEKIIIAG
jgi:hypothetical protein